MSEYFQLGEKQFVLRQFYRVNHDVTIWRAGYPEVFRLDPDIHVVLTEPIQWLWRRMNSHLTDEQFTALMGNELAFTNGTGVPGRRNWITRQELDADKDPAFDQTRVCGGAILCGVENGEDLIVETIDVRNPLPTSDWVMRRRWLRYEAINIDGYMEGDTPYGIIRPLKGAWGKKVWMPLLSSRVMTYPLKYLTKLPLGFIPPDTYQYP